MTNGNSSKLLPCPFCGGKAERSFNEFYRDDSMASCCQCGASAYWKKWQRRATLSVCADGGKDLSGAEPVEESDVRPKERLCGGSHVTCNGVDYCLGHPSCRDIANERAKKEQK
jgi:hypothetical protein